MEPMAKKNDLKLLAEKKKFFEKKRKKKKLEAIRKLSSQTRADLEVEYKAEKKRLEAVREELKPETAKGSDDRLAKPQDYTRTDAINLRNSIDDLAGNRKTKDRLQSTSVSQSANPSQIISDNRNDYRGTMSDSSSRSQKNQASILVKKRLLGVSSILFSIAVGLTILMGLVIAYLPDGREAIMAMGGMLQATAEERTARIVFLLDILFPISFAAGAALLATAFQVRGNRPLVRLFLFALLIAILADFSENSLVYQMLLGSESITSQWSITVIKYCMLGFSGVLLSVIIRPGGFLGNLCILILRYVFPLAIAVLLSGLGGVKVAEIIGAGFPVLLLLLAIYALSKQNLPE
jgi:hypothetical protein